MKPRHGPTEREIVEREHAAAKRRGALVGEETADVAVRWAIARFINPAEWGEPSELDRWILLHMDDADIIAFGYKRFAKLLRDARAALTPELAQ